MVQTQWGRVEDGRLILPEPVALPDGTVVRVVVEPVPAAPEADAEGGRSPVVVRTERGLSISGTRKTLYQVMDYVTAGWPATLIRDWMDVTDEEIAGVMAYIAAHRAEVEAEYQQVLKDADEERRYWEERNRERLAQIAALPRKPEHAAFWAKLDAVRAARAKRQQS